MPLQALIAADKEPITPLVAKMRALVNLGVSCVLVIGGSGDYFEVADHVIAMDSFRALDLTEKSQEIARQFGHSYSDSAQASFGSISQRAPIDIHSGGSHLLECRTSVSDDDDDGCGGQLCVSRQRIRLDSTHFTLPLH